MAVNYGVSVAWAAPSVAWDVPSPPVAAGKYSAAEAGHRAKDTFLNKPLNNPLRGIPAIISGKGPGEMARDADGYVPVTYTVVAYKNASTGNRLYLMEAVDRKRVKSPGLMPQASKNPTIYGPIEDFNKSVMELSELVNPGFALYSGDDALEGTAFKSGAFTPRGADYLPRRARSGNTQRKKSRPAQDSTQSSRLFEKTLARRGGEYYHKEFFIMKNTSFLSFSSVHAVLLVFFLVIAGCRSFAQTQASDAQIRQAATNLGVPYEALKQLVDSYKTQPAPSGAIAIDSVKLYEAYDANEIRADGQYKGKTLRVTGPIVDITKDYSGEYYVELTGNGSFRIIYVYCKPTETRKLGNIAKGQTITVTGVCNGRPNSLTVEIKDAVIQN